MKGNGKVDTKAVYQNSAGSLCYFNLGVYRGRAVGTDFMGDVTSTKFEFKYLKSGEDVSKDASMES